MCILALISDSLRPEYVQNIFHAYPTVTVAIAPQAVIPLRRISRSDAQGQDGIHQFHRPVAIYVP